MDTPAKPDKRSRTDLVSSKAGSTSPRKIPGNLPYLPASGTLKRAFDRIIEAPRPDKFNYDFLENILKLTGGSARATVPILKKMGFLASDGTPTDIYAKFRTEGGRPTAALAGLKNAFPEIYKRSEYAHSVDDSKLRDIVVEITGLKGNDNIVTAIRSTFNVIKGYIPSNMELSQLSESDASEGDVTDSEIRRFEAYTSGKGLGLAYNINIVLPETSDLKVLNAIFRSIRENLLQ